MRFGLKAIAALVTWACVMAAQAAAQPPADLASIADNSTVMLTTVGRKSGEPRSVKIWFVADQGRVYLQAGNGGKTDWYQNLQKTPRVTLDFGTLVLTGDARTIEDAEEGKRIHQLFLSKYWQARVSNWFGGGFGTGKVVMVVPATSGPP